MLSKIFSRRIATLTKDKFPNVKRGNYAVLGDADVQYFERNLNKNQVITDEDEVKSYNTDWLNTVCGYSSIVLKPKTTEEVSAILKYCNERKLAVCPQGGNTGLVGGSVPVFDEVIVSTALMNKILDFNTLTGVLVCQSGCVLEKLMNFLEDKGFIMPLDLGAKGSCHIGGNISTNAGGLRLVRYGSLHGTVLGIEAVSANGDVIDCMNTLKKDNTGYHLKHLFIGSEGTLGFVTQMAIQCSPYPKAINLALLSLESFDAVLKAYQLARSNLAEIISSCEMMDSVSVETTKKNLNISCPLPEAPFYMLLETSGSNQSHDEEKMNQFLSTCMDQQIITDGLSTSEPSKMRAIMELREKLATGLQKNGNLYSFDVSIPLNYFYEGVNMAQNFLKDSKDVMSVSGFGHLGDGNLHLVVTTPSFDSDFLLYLEKFVFEWVASRHGSISSEHGIGFYKPQFLSYSKTANAIELMKRMKYLMDPNCILNPLKVLP